MVMTSNSVIYCPALNLNNREPNTTVIDNCFIKPTSQNYYFPIVPTYLLPYNLISFGRLSYAPIIKSISNEQFIKTSKKILNTRLTLNVDDLVLIDDDFIKVSNNKYLSDVLASGYITTEMYYQFLRDFKDNLDLEGALKIVFIMYNSSIPQLLLLNEKKERFCLVAFSLVYEYITKLNNKYNRYKQLW